MLPAFEYRKAPSVREALALFAEKPGAAYLAGGTDLLPQLRTRRKAARVIDLKTIPELGKIRETDDGLAIGATASMAEVIAHPLVRERYPALVACCETVGAYALRNRATIAGNVCNASPAADSAVAVLVLEARFATLGPKGPRELAAQEFWKGPGATLLEPGELVTEILLPRSSAGLLASYQRLSRRRGMDLATVAVLVAKRTKGGPGPSHRVALAAVAPTPLRVPAVEAELDAGETHLARAIELVRASAQPISDVRGSADYRREMVGVLLKHGLVALC